MGLIRLICRYSLLDFVSKNEGGEGRRSPSLLRGGTFVLSQHLHCTGDHCTVLVFDIWCVWDGLFCVWSYFLVFRMVCLVFGVFLFVVEYCTIFHWVASWHKQGRRRVSHWGIHISALCCIELFCIAFYCKLLYKVGNGNALHSILLHSAYICNTIHN